MNNNCNLCNKEVNERETQEQCGLSLCLSCDGKYTDKELIELGMIKGESWNEYYADLDIPNEWVNVSYGNDELPSFTSQKDIHKAYHIWINSFNEKVRKENHDLDFGNELAPRFNITLCYGSGYDLLSTNSFDKVIKWIRENPKTKQQIKETKEIV